MNSVAIHEFPSEEKSGKLTFSITTRLLGSSRLSWRRRGRRTPPKTPAFYLTVELHLLLTRERESVRIPGVEP